ncbi:hypothetical protein HDF18_17875 [Mucilaginibacter sp. X5P1]|uniref:hypothetical protein n=1 Tax=Mucilaginibacter sp. X5P1 TaxID=2723088 RepID=UPI0016161BBF|nr:hypothetical protein [Mucilaginibacter sp. X5P1]MBB6139507.1 hypothetical protein [Mucilaginibacter sp. X5P1]
MKKLITITLLVLLVTTASYSQGDKANHIFNYQTFDVDIFNFVPIKREGVTDQKFNYALRILDDTKSVTNNDPKKLTVTDFWNITSAFVTLKEPAKNIEIAFKKAIALDAESVCSYIRMAGATNLEKAIPETFLPFYANCLEHSSSKNDKLDVKQYAIDNKLDITLVTLINSIDLDDQKFRLVTPFDQVKQRPFDIKNEQRIDSLYAVYKTYIGKTLVGKDYESVMWSVIQHSDIRMMEKYLPEISKAVEQKELSAEPLKMLIDRIYTVKYHYQIFGSQLGVPVADEKTKSDVIKNYKIE